MTSEVELIGRITELEKQVARLAASKPKHYTTGRHDARLLELEEELEEARQALARLRSQRQ